MATHNRNRAELVGDGDRVVVEQARGVHVPRDDVVGERDQLILVLLVAHEVHRLVHVRHVDALAHHLDVDDQIGDRLQ